MEKILIIEDSSKSNFGGGQRVTIDIINILLSENCQVAVLDHSLKLNTKFKLKIKNINIPLFEISSFGKIGNKPSSSFSISISEVLLYPIYVFINIYQFVSNKKLFEYFKNSQIIYCATKKAYLIAWLFSSSDKKLIFHAHSINRSNIYSIVFNFLLKRKNTKIISVSKTVTDSYKLDNIITLYNGVVNKRTSDFRKFDKNKVTVGFVGSLITWKGVDVFLQSIKYQNHNINYNVYGTGMLYDDLFLDWKSESRIDFKGFVEDMNEVYSCQIDILCLPSLDSEACPMSIIEALSYGIPVITTDIGGQAELVIDNCGILVKVNSPQDIASAVKKIIENYNYYSQNALIHFENFDFPKFSDSIKKIFRI